MSLTHVDPHVSEIVMVWIQSGDLLMVWIQISQKVKSPTPEAPSEDLDFIIQHASRKRLSEEEIAEAKHYAWELKYPKGPLCTMALTKMIFYTVSRTTWKYLFAGRWQKIWDFRSLKLAFLPCQRMTSQTTLRIIA
jgi:hypothetical protein